MTTFAMGFVFISVGSALGLLASALVCGLPIVEWSFGLGPTLLRKSAVGARIVWKLVPLGGHVMHAEADDTDAQRRLSGRASIAGWVWLVGLASFSAWALGPAGAANATSDLLAFWGFGTGVARPSPTGIVDAAALLAIPFVLVSALPFPANSAWSWLYVERPGSTGRARLLALYFGTLASIVLAWSAFVWAWGVIVP